MSSLISVVVSFLLLAPAVFAFPEYNITLRESRKFFTPARAPQMAECAAVQGCIGPQSVAGMMNGCGPINMPAPQWTCMVQMPQRTRCYWPQPGPNNVCRQDDNTPVCFCAP